MTQLEIANRLRNTINAAVEQELEHIAQLVHQMGTQTLTVSVKGTVKRMGNAFEIKAVPATGLSERLTGDPVSDIYDPDQPELPGVDK